MKKKIVAIAVSAVAIVTLAGCSAKSREQYQDSPRTVVTNTTPADLINMPDGFSNLATKCDHGNRIYVIFHNDGFGSYGSVAVVPNAPGC